MLQEVSILKNFFRVYILNCIFGDGGYLEATNVIVTKIYFFKDLKNRILLSQSA